MYSFSNTVAVAASLLTVCGVLALPISVSEVLEIIDYPTVLGGSTFRIPQVLNPGYKGAVASGPVAYAKALSKHNVSMPSDVAGALMEVVRTIQGAASLDTVTTTPLAFDSEYLCPVSIGTPPQILHLDFDTGSSDLWVFSSETTPLEVNGQALYNPKLSTSATRLQGATWQIGYADGSGSNGDVYIDKVSIGTVTVNRQAVESAQNVSSSFTANSASSGLLGLAFDNINTVTPKQNTFFTNARQSLAMPLFTANLKKGAEGNYNFGFIDKTEFTGSISYTPVNTANGFWQFTGSGFAVGSGAFQSLPINAIADTGTTLLLMPDAVVTAYYAQVKGASYSASQGGYVFPCSAVLPNFTFGVGTYRGDIPGSYMNYAPTGTTGDTCYGGLQSSTGIGFAIYGDILLKAQFVVFDAGNARLGWANKAL